MYLTLTTYAEVWTVNYRMSVGVGSLNYIPLGLGFYVGAMVSTNTLCVSPHSVPRCIVPLL